MPGGAGGGPTVPMQPGLPHLGVALQMAPPTPQGLRRKQLGLKSDLPGLVWVTWEIRVLS